ncbi:MAG: phosphoribosylglycinamide formyltransferase [Spirochaetota bacterium]
MANYAVFASGRGTNFRSIESALRDTRHSLVCLVTDRPDCPAAGYAASREIDVVPLEYRGRDKGDLERELVGVLDKKAVELCVLAGFMRLLSPVMVDAFPKRIVNIHPSLLPKYPGVGAIEKSFQSGDTVAGITIHYVDYGMDTGTVIVQKTFSRESGETIESFEARIHSLEHRTYPQVVGRLLDACDAAPSVRTCR